MYDQQNIGHHSSVEFGIGTLRQGAQVLPVEKLCLGLPFYGRLEGAGEWKTYEVCTHANALPSPHTLQRNRPLSFLGRAWLFHFACRT